MATLTEIRNAFTNTDLRGKIEAAVVIIAEEIRGEDPATANHVNRLIWAKEAFVHWEQKAIEMQPAMIAANKDLDIGAILGASQSAIETAVRNAVNVFATGA